MINPWHFVRSSTKSCCMKHESCIEIISDSTASRAQYFDSLKLQVGGFLRAQTKKIKKFTLIKIIYKPTLYSLILFEKILNHVIRCHWMMTVNSEMDGTRQQSLFDILTQYWIIFCIWRKWYSVYKITMHWSDCKLFKWEYPPESHCPKCFRKSLPVSIYMYSKIEPRTLLCRILKCEDKV